MEGVLRLMGMDEGKGRSIVMKLERMDQVELSLDYGFTGESG